VHDDDSVDVRQILQLMRGQHSGHALEHASDAFEESDIIPSSCVSVVFTGMRDREGGILDVHVLADMGVHSRQHVVQQNDRGS
jgi:hypothetical protein